MIIKLQDRVGALEAMVGMLEEDVNGVGPEAFMDMLEKARKLSAKARVARMDEWVKKFKDRKRD